MKNKKNNIGKKKKDIDKILLVSLLVCTVICLILGITLFAIGIRKIVPVILIFVLSFIVSVVILFLSREVFFMKRAKDRSLKEKRA